MINNFLLIAFVQEIVWRECTASLTRRYICGYANFIEYCTAAGKEGEVAVFIKLVGNSSDVGEMSIRTGRGSRDASYEDDTSATMMERTWLHKMLMPL